jgi:hypothetical protein
LKLKKIQLISNSSLKLLIEDAVKKKCGVRIKARGSSMRPFVLNNDIITIYPYLDAHPSIGDVATFIHPGTGKLLIHRIIKIDGDGHFTFKGDNMLSKDGSVKQKNILGFVGKVQRGEKEYRFQAGKGNPILVYLSKYNIIFTLFAFQRKIGTLFAKTY